VAWETQQDECKNNIGGRKWNDRPWSSSTENSTSDEEQADRGFTSFFIIIFFNIDKIFEEKETKNVS